MNRNVGISCTLCASSTTPSFTMTSGYELHRCPSCGLEFSHPQPEIV